MSLKFGLIRVLGPMFILVPQIGHANEANANLLCQIGPKVCAKQHFANRSDMIKSIPNQYKKAVDIALIDIDKLVKANSSAAREAAKAREAGKQLQPVERSKDLVGSGLSLPTGSLREGGKSANQGDDLIRGKNRGKAGSDDIGLINRAVPSDGRDKSPGGSLGGAVTATMPTRDSLLKDATTIRSDTSTRAADGTVTRVIVADSGTSTTETTVHSDGTGLESSVWQGLDGSSQFKIVAITPELISVIRGSPDHSDRGPADYALYRSTDRGTSWIREQTRRTTAGGSDGLPQPAAPQDRRGDVDPGAPIAPAGSPICPPGMRDCGVPDLATVVNRFRERTSRPGSEPAPQPAPSIQVDRRAPLANPSPVEPMGGATRGRSPIDRRNDTVDPPRPIK